MVALKGTKTLFTDILELGCENMPRIRRVGVTFPPDLLKDFDETIRAIGYTNRSKAVQDAVRMFVAERKRFQDESGNQAGVVMMVYDHETRGLENTLTRAQHNFTKIVCSTMHIHLNETDCLEVVAVRGSGPQIRKLSDELACKKGVKLLKTVIVSV
jgi:CopG family nickel-responsive transcriptional regulator